jgi:hypothetical protein
MNHSLDEYSNIESANENELIHDFVVVSIHESQCSVDDDSDDDYSYDYCDDVCSLLSNDEHGGGGGHDLLSDSLEMTGSSSLHLKDSILTVPSVLMKDLDDAHAAASLTRIMGLTDDDSGVESTSPSSLCSSEESKFPDDEHPSDDVGSFSSPPIDEVEKDEFSFSAVVNAIESPTMGPTTTTTTPTCSSREVVERTDSSTPRCGSPVQSSFVSCVGQEVGATVADEGHTVIRPREEPTTCLLIATNRSQQNTITSSNNSIDIPTTGSRTSNKKRRKKLKLLKKAQAAASAAHKLSERSLETIKMPKAHSTGGGGNFPHLQALRMRSSPSRGSSKKIANIAVVCAKDTMSAYRDELMRTNKPATAGG